MFVLLACATFRPTDKNKLRDALQAWVTKSNSTPYEDQSISNWDTSLITDMSHLFCSTGYGAKCRLNAIGYDNFNDDIGAWNVSSVTTMANMFEGASSFNQSLDSWNVSSVVDMSYMFKSAASFNQPLNSWDVSSVTDMSTMFQYARSFNQSLDSWNVSSVTDMSSMFRYATAFNQPLNSWNVSSVADMRWMFMNATSFNQLLCGWNMNPVRSLPADQAPSLTGGLPKTTDMFKNSAGGTTYCTYAQEYAQCVDMITPQVRASLSKHLNKMDLQYFYSENCCDSDSCGDVSKSSFVNAILNDIH